MLPQLNFFKFIRIVSTVIVFSMLGKLKRQKFAAVTMKLFNVKSSYGWCLGATCRIKSTRYFNEYIIFGSYLELLNC